MNLIAISFIAAALMGAIVELSSGAPSISTESRVIGGNPVPAGLYPFMAGFLVPAFNREMFKKCGGTLITTKHILTAAHCVFGVDVSGINVFINSPETRNTGSSSAVVRTIKSAKIHELYDDRNSINDIAILTLNQPVTTITPVKLASNPSVTYAGQAATLVGWGLVSQQSKNIKVLNNGECQTENRTPINNSQLCTDVPNRFFCDGDSGGPILSAKVQIGIVSFGPNPCVSPFTSGVYTRVSSFINWINANTAK